MSCKYCKTMNTDHYLADQPSCAFKTNIFNSDNWNCATMSIIRTLSDETFYKWTPGKRIWNDEQQSGAIVPYDSKFIILGWYKNRGRIEIARIMDEIVMRELTFEDAEECIKYWEERNLEELY